MKKTFLILAIAFTAVSANAQFLFRISGKKIKEPSYILGSVHTLPGSLLDSIPEFIEAESKCRQLYAEYDISSQQSMAQAQAAGQQAISLPEGKNIFDVLNQDQIDLLNTRFKETFQVNFTDSVMKTVWNYQPNVLMTTPESRPGFLYSHSNQTGRSSGAHGIVSVSPPGCNAPSPRRRQAPSRCGSVTVTLSAPSSKTGPPGRSPA